MKSKLNETFERHKKLMKESLQLGSWGDEVEDLLDKLRETEKNVSQLYQRVADATSNAGRRPKKKDLEPIWGDMIDAGHSLQRAAEMLRRIWTPGRESKPAADWSGYYEPGRSAPPGPSHGW